MGIAKLNGSEALAAPPTVFGGGGRQRESGESREKKCQASQRQWAQALMKQVMLHLKWTLLPPLLQ
ncbi:hypothetical protein ACPTGE_03230 [Pseudomonas aeruginosa]|uniref:hypothetical protein n=1 Tax=Pseudomonas aeruginosa TaxID=287 RepID=UPI001117A897|nr:hypothetical protein [Pseudomonas aeruginosa]MBA4942361.1 hypothetical protein [Pseudomonas aeruginosa]HDR2991149.1 hypothetical protein [Pseudomonas aeruginosa]HDR3053190.1 hypothetical protein [Pseudomonas aeruginosa]HDR3059306.1 hypothetical protein [Pseudomonas aeruginosa]HDR3081385.1 hypothetical protein [Pseudomonas aeruginosa]